MAPIRDGHLSSDIVVFILAFCLFCGNRVCTQACSINWWQSFLSEASPRQLNHPLRRAAWDKFIRNFCTGLQQRLWCVLSIFCMLGSRNWTRFSKDSVCKKRPFPHSCLLSSLICAKRVHCEPGASMWTWMCGWNVWKKDSVMFSFVLTFLPSGQNEQYVQILMFSSSDCLVVGHIICHF